MVRKKFQQDILSWRRAEVVKLMSRGKSVNDIATILKVDPRTIYRDMEYANRSAHMIIDKYVTDTVPKELMKCLSRLNQASDEAWKIVDNKETSDREKIAALTQARQSAVDIIETLTNNKQLIYQVLSSPSSSDEQQQQQEDVIEEDEEPPQEEEVEGEEEEEDELLTEDSRATTKADDPNRVF
jgi:hypothetical protein